MADMLEIPLRGRPCTGFQGLGFMGLGSRLIRASGSGLMSQVGYRGVLGLMLAGLVHPPKQGPSDCLVTLNPKSYNNMSQPNTQNDVLTRIHRVLIWGYKLFSLKLAQTPKQGPCKDHSPCPSGLHGFHASFWEGRQTLNL